MKKRMIYSAVFCFIVCTAAATVLAGCDFVTDIVDDLTGNESGSSSSSSSTASSASSTASTGATVTASSSATWSYDASFPVCAVDTGTRYVTISGDISGKTIYLAKENPFSSTISRNSTRYVSSSSGLTSEISVPSAGGRSADTDTDDAAVSGVEDSSRTYFVPPAMSPLSQTAVSSSRSASADTTSAEKTYAVGATKSLYIDTDSNISTFESATATCRAVGTYCYVWVVGTGDTSTYYTSTSGGASGEQVDPTIVNNIAAKFDAMYPVIRNVFGDESDKILYYTGSAWDTEDMSVVSTTGTKVNIVVYDIAKDYSSSSSSGIIGYFYAKDYFQSGQSSYPSGFSAAASYSNQGKYFYVDAYYAVKSITEMYSTIAHEFQHMVDFNTKYITNNLSASTWYNEMLSMLCEDMMQSYLGIDDSEGPKARLTTFNEYYPVVGVEYNSSSNSTKVISYATCYSFGAWLARQYGGAALLQAMSSNSSVDYDSVVAAVNSVNGTSYTMTDLLNQYTQACLFNSSTVQASYSYPTHNQAAAQTLSYSSYTYPMTSINLWDSAYYWTNNQMYTSSYICNSTSSSKYIGPVVFSNSILYDIRPYGFTLHQLGTASGDSVTLTFSSTGSSNLKMYLMIQ